MMICQKENRPVKLPIEIDKNTLDMLGNTNVVFYTILWGQINLRVLCNAFLSDRNLWNTVDLRTKCGESQKDSPQLMKWITVYFLFRFLS